MKGRKRKPIRTRVSDTSFNMSKWCRLHYKDGTIFNVPMLCNELGMNPDSRSDYNKVYGVILSWRNGLIDYYNKQKKIGMLDGMNRYEAWDVMLNNYNKNDAYVFLSQYDKTANIKYFIQPSFDMLENMDIKRIEKQWRGIKTVLEEMQTVDAQLKLPDGSRQPVTKLLKAGKKVDTLLSHGDKKRIF